MQHLLRITQHALDDLNEFSAHHLRLLLSGASANNTSTSEANDLVSEAGSVSNENIDGEDIALKIILQPGKSGHTASSSLEPYAPTLNILYPPNQIPPSSSTSSPLATYIANELQKVFAEEQATLAYLLKLNPNSHNTKIKSLSPEVTAALARQSTRTFKYAPTYHLTFSLFTPNSEPSAWDVDSALREFLWPLLETLSPISNFTVDTQVQLYATFAPSMDQPEYDEQLKAWVLKKEALSGFINAAEWPLSPGIGVGPTINFVLYVPEVGHTPLLVKGSGSNSWLVPQWGGVYILNSPEVFKKGFAVPQHLDKATVTPAILSFSNQLLSLLGLPQSPQSFPLRMATLMRVRAASLIFSASSTLGALARLTQALPSIAIPDTVAKSVEQTTSRLEEACNDLRAGRFQSALSHARVAETEAEKAFFERSMVGQVYFPDEHKVAVYLPLLGPVAVPLIMAGLKEIKKLVGR